MECELNVMFSDPKFSDHRLREKYTPKTKPKQKKFNNEDESGEDCATNYNVHVFRQISQPITNEKETNSLVGFQTALPTAACWCKHFCATFPHQHKCASNIWKRTSKGEGTCCFMPSS